MKRIGVAFAVNDNYVSHLEVALYSLFEHNASHGFDVYVLSSHLSRHAQERLELISQSYDNSTINILSLDGEIFKDFKIHAHFSRDIYSRYLLPQLLPTLDRVLYIDADTLVRGDILELYELDLKDSYLAAAKDIGIQKKQFRGYMQSLGLDSNNYFNSGVLLMDLARMRANKKVEELFAVTSRYGDNLQHPDQDAINIVFKNEILELPRKWNFQDEDRKVAPSQLASASIIHYTTEKKPWNTPNVARSHNKKAHEYYEQYEYSYYHEFAYDKKVSVIMPVYNTKTEYLDEALQSVLGQIYSNIEVIVVDDGSHSGTAKYLDKIAKDDERIKVIHKANAGTNRARQTGFEQSDGEYVTFIDSDDIVEPNMILKLMRACRDDKTDMAVCEFWAEDTPRKNEVARGTVVIKGRDKISSCRYTGFPDMRTVGVVWAKLYKRTVIEKVDWDFCDYAITEDEFMNVQIFAHTQSASLVPDQLYYYRQQVASSKESHFPSMNRYLRKEIPMLRTVSDLYNNSINLYLSEGIKYDNSALLANYIALLRKQIKQLLASGNFDDANTQELQSQKKENLNKIIEQKSLTDIEKLSAIATFDSPKYIDLALSAENSYRNLLSSYNVDKADLLRTIDDLRTQHAQFMGIKRSSKLLAGNIKRRIKLRTRIRSHFTK